MRPQRTVTSAITLLCCIAFASACGGAKDANVNDSSAGVEGSRDGAIVRSYDSAPEMTIDASKSYMATIETNLGVIKIELDAAGAPITVNNFVFLARNKFYDGLTFHRIGQGFMIQGGDPEGTGAGGPGYAFEDELPTDGYEIGSIAMANSGADTNGSQFFIVSGEQGAGLPNLYSRFGIVSEGMDVVHALEALGPPDGSASDPISAAEIIKITIDES